MLYLRRRFRFAALLSALVMAALPAYLYAATVLTKLQLDISISGLYENTGDIFDAEMIPKILFNASLTDGDAADKAEVFYYDENTVTASGTNSIDVYGGLVDAYGTTLNIAKLKLVMVRNKSTTAGDVLRVTRPATDGVNIFGADADYVTVGPGGVFLWYNPSLAGAAVVDTDTDNIDIVEAGAANTVSYTITIVGTD